MTKTLADSDTREGPRVAGLTLLTLGVIIGTAVAMDKLGLGWVWEFIFLLPFWQGFALSAALWGAIMLLLLNLPRVAQVATELVLSAPAALRALAGKAMSASTRVTFAVLSALAAVFAVVARITEPFRIGLALMAEPIVTAAAPLVEPLRKLRRAAAALAAVFDQLRDLWRSVVRPLLSRAAIFFGGLQLEWTLWRSYRTEFREKYVSFREFKRALNERMYARAGGSPRDDAPPARDPFETACDVLGLPADGNFTESEFKARYRALMKKAHPDIAGPNERAASINAACAEIRKRKGWS